MEPNDATPFLPERRSMKALREAAAGCRGCHLWRHATQTVFGEGRKSSRVAGRELDRGREAAGIARKDAYLTNVVSAA